MIKLNIQALDIHVHVVPKEDAYDFSYNLVVLINIFLEIKAILSSPVVLLSETPHAVTEKSSM